MATDDWGTAEEAKLDRRLAKMQKINKKNRKRIYRNFPINRDNKSTLDNPWISSSEDTGGH